MCDGGQGGEDGRQAGVSEDRDAVSTHQVSHIGTLWLAVDLEKNLSKVPHLPQKGPMLWLSSPPYSLHEKV